MFNKLVNIKSVVAALFVVLMIGCNTNTTNPVDPVPGAPTGVAAQSISETSIAVKWQAPLAGALPTGYSVEYMETGTTTVMKKSVGSSTLSTELTGLMEGKIYDVMVYALNDTAKSVASVKVSWAPARRGIGTYDLYSSNNSTFGSGLSIFRTGNASPTTLLIAKGDEWDICFDDFTNASTPLIASPGVSGYVDPVTYQFPNGKDARITYWGKEYKDITSLDDIYETDALMVNDTSESSFFLNSIGGTSNWGGIIAWKQNDGASYNFAKILLKRNSATSSFVWGTGADTYVQMEVSYQTMANVPYAIKMRIDEEMNRQAVSRKLND